MIIYFMRPTAWSPEDTMHVGKRRHLVLIALALALIGCLLAIFTFAPAYLLVFVVVTLAVGIVLVIRNVK